MADPTFRNPLRTLHLLVLFGCFPLSSALRTTPPIVRNVVATSRRQWLASAGVAVAAGTSAHVRPLTAAAASSHNDDTPTEPSDLPDLKRRLVALASRRDAGAAPASSDDLDALVRRLCRLNPTSSPGSAAAYAPLSDGRWRVLYAPHIETLSRWGRTRFDPIGYDLSGDAIVSNVGYDSFFFGRGWLNAAGTFSSVDDDTVTRIDFEDFSWNAGRDLPSFADSESVLPALIRGIGRAGFLPSISKFPVEYLDKDLCIFRFPPLGVRIVAQKLV